MIEISNPVELEQGQPARDRRSREERMSLAELEKKLSLYPGIQVHM
jgi:hypothetical protein